MAAHLRYSTGAGRGGRQPGAGRPRGAKNKRQPVQLETLTAGRKLPLEYMLAVMNDETATQERRDRFAIAAAPYLHPRLTAISEAKALYEMSGEELELVMHKEMRHAENQGDVEGAERLRETLYGRRGASAAPPQRGNGVRKPA